MTSLSAKNRNVEARYYDSEYRFTEDVGLYLEMAGKIRGEILELGCGTGRIVIPFAENGYRITGLDISPLMLEKAREKIIKLPKKVRQRITRQGIGRGQYQGIAIGIHRLNVPLQHLISVYRQIVKLCDHRRLIEVHDLDGDLGYRREGHAGTVSQG